MTVADRLAKLRERARREELVVLVWGPGEASAGSSAEMKAFWNKRNQIKDSIKAHFLGAHVLFSEADELRDHTRDLEDLLTEELAHAEIADCIVVLDVSRGAHVEVDRFSAVPRIAAKIRILLPEKYVGHAGPVGVVHRNVRAIGFSELEFSECRLATEKAIGIVMSFAIRKLMESSRFGS